MSVFETNGVTLTPITLPLSLNLYQQAYLQTSPDFTRTTKEQGVVEKMRQALHCSVMVERKGKGAFSVTYYGTFIFPETGQRSTGRLTVGEGRIVSFEEARAQKGDTELSGTVTPGLIDAHVHLLLNAGANPVAHLLGLSLTERVLMAQAHMRAQLAAGVTTVRDLGGSGQYRG